MCVKFSALGLLSLWPRRINISVSHFHVLLCFLNSKQALASYRHLIKNAINMQHNDLQFFIIFKSIVSGFDERTQIGFLSYKFNIFHWICLQVKGGKIWKIMGIHVLPDVLDGGGHFWTRRSWTTRNHCPINTGTSEELSNLWFDDQSSCYRWGWISYLSWLAVFLPFVAVGIFGITFDWWMCRFKTGGSECL